MIRSLFIFLLLTLPLMGCAQVIIQFIPEVSGRNVDGLFQCKIINPGKAQNATVTITVTEKTQGTICTIKTPSFGLVQGVNGIPATAARGASILFSGSKAGQLTQLNRQFMAGDYDYCYDVKLAQSDLPDEECFSYLLAPFSDLSLIEPYDQDKVCNTKPLFSWQPLIPGIPGSYYQLVLTDIRSGQNATEALNYNLPVINQSGIVAPILPYPPIAQELQRGKSYAWQVTAYKDQTILTRSEIWSFKVDCQDSLVKAPDDGYRDIEDLAKGNYYIAKGFLKFSLVNPYKGHDLIYKITTLNDTDKKIKGLPNIKLQTGKNQIIIDLSETGAFENGHYYFIKVTLPNGITKNLRFLYAEPNE